MLGTKMQPQTIHDWQDLIHRRRLTIIQVATVAFGVVVLGTLLWPPIYESSSLILVQDNRAQLLVSPAVQDNSSNRPTVVANPVTEQDLNSERELLTSLYLINQAVEGLPPPARYSKAIAAAVRVFRSLVDLPAQGYRAFHGTPSVDEQELWALDLARHLSSSVIRRSNIVEVDFRWRDPKECQRFLSKLVSQYLEYHSGLSHDPQTEQFFQSQAALLSGRLQASEEKLRAFEVQTGVKDPQEQKQALINQIAGLETDYSKTTAQLAASTQEASNLETQLSQTSDRVPKETKVVQNMALEQMKPQALQLEAERAELLARYQPDSRRIQEIDAKLDAPRRILSRENGLQVQEKSTDINPVWVTADSNLVQAKATTASLKASQTALHDQIQNTREELTKLVNDGVEIERLNHEVESDKKHMCRTPVRSKKLAPRMLSTAARSSTSVSRPPLRSAAPDIAQRSVESRCRVGSGAGVRVARRLHAGTV
jgi:uncharacterized protein involved in exopolysaccharide biosynthesis